MSDPTNPGGPTPPPPPGAPIPPGEPTPPPDDSPGKKAALVFVGLLVIAAIVVGAILLANGGDDDEDLSADVTTGEVIGSGTSETTSTTSTTSTTVESTTTVPETTVPETTVPETTVPETTVPETTEPPETTAPETTAPPETTVPPVAPADATPLGILEANPDQFSILLDLIRQAGLDDDLSEEGATFTIFAPTNEAFEGVTPPEDQEELAAILLHHVVADSVDAATLFAADGPTEIETLNGMLAVDAGAQTIGDGATVLFPDLEATGDPDGYVHGIDQILIPAG